MTRMNCCIATIVSANYLAYARLLSESVQQHARGWYVRVLIVDRATEEIRAAVSASGLTATFAEDLGLADFEEIAFKYELVELNTALKPTFLRMLFGEGFDRVAYFDPDIRLFGPLDSISLALDTHEIVVTPHALAPAMDGLRPSDIDFLRNGAYNLGFIALARGRHSERLLDWWEERCLSYGFSDLAFGTFVDQKWMDLVPSYFGGVDVLRDPGCNVAYWNLHERVLTRSSNGRIQANDSPLSFFHFSGVKTSAPKVLSRHQTRHQLVPGTLLAEIVEDYCQSLVRLGHDNFSKINYTFSKFNDGSTISLTVRRASCFIATNGMPFGRPDAFGSVFDAKGIRPRRESTPSAAVNTLNFDHGNRNVATANRAVRWLTSLIGVDRTLALLKYAAFLTRESNYARVLSATSFELSHPRTRRTAAVSDDGAR